MERLILIYGPLAVFLLLMLSGIAIPLGEDIITIPAGVLIAHGKLNPWLTLVCAYAGVVLSDCLWFGICHHYGTPLLHKRWIKRLLHPRRLLVAKHQFEKRGVWLVVMARFIPTSRTTTITIAGMLQMSFWKFALTTAACVLITAPMQLGLGYLIGRELSTKSTAHLALQVIGVATLIIAVLVIIGWYSQHRLSRARPPRAKASWLRRFRIRRKRPVAIKN